MRYYFVFFAFIFTQIFAQKQPTKLSPSKEPFFLQNINQKQEEKVKHIHSDTFGVSKNKFDGNPHFSGNVIFTHQGSTLMADEVILYQEENFVKAFGNVKLQNADGSIITADEMEYDGNTERGIARKNVVLTDPKQTINTNILYYDRKTNQAYFNTGGTIRDYQGSVMHTKSATYDIGAKEIDFTGNVRIDNPKYILEGANIKQNQQTNTAHFSGATTIFDKKNPRNKVYTEQGSFNQSTNEVFLNKNSVIYYNNKKLTGDRLYFNRNTNFGKGDGNITLDDPYENRYIKGGYGEIYQDKDSAMVTDKPYAVKILSKDTIYFSAEKFITFQKIDKKTQTKKSYLRAYKRARFFKSNAQARADSISFDETDGVLHFSIKPILWSGEKQVTGDKIEAYFNTKNENIDSLKVIGNAMAISKSDSLNLKDEFDQIKGRRMIVIYEENQIKKAKVIGNAQAITYADDINEKTNKKERIGVNLSTCGEIVADVEERKIQVVSCNIGASMETYPMSFISKEKRFFPDFNWNTKDRLRRWQDIFFDSPNYEEIKYTSDNTLYENAQRELNNKKAKEESTHPKRKKK